MYALRYEMYIITEFVLVEILLENLVVVFIFYVNRNRRIDNRHRQSILNCSLLWWRLQKRPRKFL